MITESPITLQELCLSTICDNISFYVETYEDPIDGKRCRFKDPELFLINELSEKLLQKCVENQIICDAILNIFTANNTKLRCVKLKKCKVSSKGLHVLKQHKITDLECVNIKMNIRDILDCLSDWTIANMVNANFSYGSFIDLSRHRWTMMRVCSLSNLRSLNLSYTELNQRCFQMICEDLKHLEKLDISGTFVTDLNPLTVLSSKLLSLSICDLPIVNNWNIIAKLTRLYHLDVSLVNEKLSNLVSLHNPPHIIPSLLEEEINLPNLVSFDMSGWRNFESADLLMHFIERHPKLEFLGIVVTLVASNPIFSDNESKLYPNHLIIAGLENKAQIKVTLTKYKERAGYVQKALYHLFQLTNLFHGAKPDMFKLILPVMEIHAKKSGVQMAATACLYNLTRGELSKTIHPKWLSKAVNLTLGAMQSFPGDSQLQKNSLLTLCSDRILQDVTFDRFRCAKLVLDALCKFDDISMNRMAVAICSILASKISTKETSELGSQIKYMQKLLDMVKNRADSELSDITLMFTLSALWNLTDESAATCNVFLELGGANLFLNVLKSFRNDFAVETKVLGLLNNIAEVEYLRASLMLDSLISELHLLLKSEHIDVSYFAAGIIAHLTSDGDSKWTVTSHTRREMLQALEAAVSQWQVPESEMVAYRSFKPFFSLLKTEIDYQVQLWAVWAIHHVCTKSPRRYCMMLKEEEGDSLLNELITCKESHSEIKRICLQILEALNVIGC